LETFEKSKDYGNKLHAAFAKVKHLNDIDMALAEVAREGLIIDAEKADLKQKMLGIIAKVRHLFEVAEENVKNEREILMPNGKPLRPDRVVREGNKITIVDYKTGSKSNSHKTQVRQYMDIYRDMGYAEVKGVLLYVESEEVVAV
jgi:RecB family exonuclease